MTIDYPDLYIRGGWARPAGDSTIPVISPPPSSESDRFPRHRDRRRRRGRRCPRRAYRLGVVDRGSAR